VVSTNTSTAVSGGTSSTTLTLNDTGATFTGNAGVPVVVTGIANGTTTNDAVNYGQLTSFRAQILDQISVTEKKLAGGIASTIAIANVPNLDAGKQFTLGVGVGRYMGESAFAVGANYRLNDSTTLRGTVGRASGSGTAVGVGAGFSW
jgi:autotransporter adhesin